MSDLNTLNNAECRSMTIPSTSTHIKRDDDVIRENRRLTVREVTDKVGISAGSCNRILGSKFKMHRVNAKFASNYLPMPMIKKTFLWVHSYWNDGVVVLVSKRSPYSKRSKLKMMLVVFFERKIIVHQEFVSCGKNEVYRRNLKSLNCEKKSSKTFSVPQTFPVSKT